MVHVIWVEVCWVSITHSLHSLHHDRILPLGHHTYHTLLPFVPARQHFNLQWITYQWVSGKHDQHSNLLGSCLDIHNVMQCSSVSRPCAPHAGTHSAAFISTLILYILLVRGSTTSHRRMTLQLHHLQEHTNYVYVEDNNYLPSLQGIFSSLLLVPLAFSCDPSTVPLAWQRMSMASKTWRLRLRLCTDMGSKVDTCTIQYCVCA